MRLPKRTINSSTKITVKRMLPTTGEVLVQRGQQVDALKVVAVTRLPRRYCIVDVARRLALSPTEMAEVMLKAEGDPVVANEVIAAAPGGLSLFRRSVRAPAGGRVASIGYGWVLLELDVATIEVQAFVNGVISWIAPEQGVVIDTVGTLVEATCGFGGEAYGLLKRLTNSPFEPLTEDVIDTSCHDTIILGGRSVDEAVLRKAEQMQVRGIIVGSFDAALMKLEPRPKVRVVATEGFGDISMSPLAFGILRGLSGKEISLRASTPNLALAPGLAGEVTPVIIASAGRISPPATRASDQFEGEEMQLGSQVRITRGRLQGSRGVIVSLPEEPQKTEAGILAEGAYVKVDEVASFVPWANLEALG
jgi:hypothetical protein